MIKSSCAYSVELFDIINIIFKIPEFKKDQIFSNMHLKYAYIWYVVDLEPLLYMTIHIVAFYEDSQISQCSCIFAICYL